MPENTKENVLQPSRSVEPSPDFRTPQEGSSDDSENKLTDRTLRILAEGTAAATGDDFSVIGEMRGPGAGCALCLCRRNAQRDGVAISSLLGRFGFSRGVHLSFSENALPASRGRSHLRDFIGLAGEIPRGPLTAADRRRELYRRADAERAGPNARTLGGFAPGAYGTVGRGYCRAANIRSAWVCRVGAQCIVFIYLGRIPIDAVQNRVNSFTITTLFHRVECRGCRVRCADFGRMDFKLASKKDRHEFKKERIAEIRLFAMGTSVFSF